MLAGRQAARRSTVALALALALLAGGIAAPLGSSAATKDVLLNELSVNPPSADSPYEFIELRGGPGESIAAGLYVAVLEGDRVTSGSSAGQTGVADMVVDLGGQAFGSNGLLMVKSPEGGHAPAEGTTVLGEPQLAEPGGLENQSLSVLVVASPASAIVEQADYDRNDDGRLELPPGATVVDAIAWSDGGQGDLLYGGVVLLLESGVPDAATRFPGNDSPLRGAAWYGGDLTGGSSDSLAYGSNVSANFPNGGALTPGAPNAPAPANAPISLSCPPPLATGAGQAASAEVAASDPDGRVIGAAIVEGQPPGITLDGFAAAGAPGERAGATITVAQTTAAGSYRVVVRFSNDDSPPQTASCAVQVSVVVPSGLRIHSIQGATHVSPYDTAPVTAVPGVVTAVAAEGFYMQDPAPDDETATSDGIFVATRGAPAVRVGDSVLVDGLVEEHRPGCVLGCPTASDAYANLSVTRLGGAPKVVVLSSGNSLPEPIAISGAGRTPPGSVIDDDTGGDVETGPTTFDAESDAIDYYESLEGMLVRLAGPLVVGPTADDGTFVVVGDGGDSAGPRTQRGGLLVAPNDPNPERILVAGRLLADSPPKVSVGDRFADAIAGVIDYDEGAYRLLNTARLPRTVAGDLARETLAFPAQGADDLHVAAIDAGGLSAADPASTFDRLAGLVVEQLKAPDIVALRDVRDRSGAADDGAVAGDASFEALLNAISIAGGPDYQYRQIDPLEGQDGGLPGENPRVGLLFNPARVSFVDRPAPPAGAGPATEPVGIVSGPGGPRLTISPGRIAPGDPAFAGSRKPLAGEFRFRGRSLFVVAAHLASSSEDQPLFGRFQPPGRPGEAQRRAQARVVNQFVRSILAADQRASVVVLGDMGDPEWSETLRLVAGEELSALTTALPQGERYTAVRGGNGLALDHILVSESLLSRFAARYDVVHLNAEFAGRSGDHDPVLARFTIPPPAALALAVEALKPKVERGETATFRLSYRFDRMTDLRLSVTVPSGAAFVGASGGGVLEGGVVSWALDGVAPGEGSVELRLRALELGPLRLAGRLSDSDGAVEAAASFLVVPRPAIYMPVVGR